MVQPMYTARAEHVTVLTGLPALLRMLLALDGACAAFSRLRAINTTSESLLRADIDAWRGVLPATCKVALVYGMSEGAPLTEWFLPDRQQDGPARLHFIAHLPRLPSGKLDACALAAHAGAGLPAPGCCVGWDYRSAGLRNDVISCRLRLPHCRTGCRWRLPHCRPRAVRSPPWTRKRLARTTTSAAPRNSCARRWIPRRMA